ncbi:MULTISPECIES: hypothetical protein [unclassified Streptomyces]|uniref:Uncharacterized protein n=1 Tax=Streptomyces sp. NBC_00180 TaxID=2903632 RepID=A0AAU1ICQ4_9ACTN|nr:hypothetical protein OG331_03395 [Streptomyces sp. NBC_01017]WSV34887.1 hypothetical protein OG331_48580 [Streptomyces sp. NBC_01017]
MSDKPKYGWTVTLQVDGEEKTVLIKPHESAGSYDAVAQAALRVAGESSPCADVRFSRLCARYQDY